MLKTVPRTISGRSRLMGMRDQEVDFPRVPVRVTDDAQANTIDINSFKNFEYRGHDREVSHPERPRTATGPSPRKPGSKRETKDDLYFNPLAVHGAGTTFYDFDLPRRSNTTDSKTLKSSLPAPQSPSLTQRPTSPEEMISQQANMVVPETEIGMALGSPSHQPAHWSQQAQTEATQSPSPHTAGDSVASSSPSSHIMGDSVTSSMAPPTKQKKSKWGVLGGLFGGKKSVEPQPFYHLEPESTIQPTGTVATTIEANKYHNFSEPPHPVEETTKGRSRGRSISTRITKIKTSKPNMKRANTLPVNQDFQVSSDRGTPTITLEGGPLTDHHHALAQANGSLGHKLDVNIPSIQMERYSIMFGSVLQKQPNNSSSLLARRQATLDKSKTVNEAVASKEQDLQNREKRLMPRRATSPQPSRSPAFSLFPSTPSRNSHREPSPLRSRYGASGTLQRSNTSPAVLSPSQPNFSLGPGNEAHMMIMGTSSPIAVTPGISDDSPTIPLAGKVKQPKSNSAGKLLAKGKAVDKRWTPDDSHLILSSPDSGDDADYTYTSSPLHDSQPLKPKLVEPAWEIVNRQPEQNIPTIPPTTASSNISNHSTPTSISSSAASISTTATSISGPTTFKSSTITTTVPLQPNPRLPPSTSSRTRLNDLTASATSEVSINSTDDAEARLKSAADVSIARQISVSRQQRQLLVPISTIGGTSSSASMAGDGRHNANFPSPMTQIINPATELASTASSRGTVTLAAKGERKKPLALIRSKSSPLVERLHVVTAQKANTPTLVVVPGPKDNEFVKAWDGNTTSSPTIHPGTPVQFGNLSIAERRRGKEMGEIKIGVSVRRKEGRGRVGEGRRAAEKSNEAVRNGENTQHRGRQRNSERVVVERMSVASTSN